MADTTPTRRTLTVRQRRFVAEYAIDRNGTAAVFRAFGPTTRDGRRRTARGARTAAARMLANDNIRAEVEATIRGHAKACRISATRVLRELAMIAFADIGDLFDTDPARPGAALEQLLAMMEAEGLAAEPVAPGGRL